MRKLTLLKFLLVGALSSIALSAQPASAPYKIAVVDVQKVLTQSDAGKVAVEKLKKLQEDQVAKGQALNNEITKLDQQIVTGRVNLSEEKLAQLTKTVAEKRAAMQRFAEEADKKISEERDRAIQALEVKIKPVIEAIAKESGIHAIFNKFESGLIYASEQDDISDAVIRRFNEQTASAPKGK